jgi:hypothetical protein
MPHKSKSKVIPDKEKKEKEHLGPKLQLIGRGKKSQKKVKET